MRKGLKMDKCREEFELFWINRCKELEIKCVLTRSAIDGDYLYIDANYAWIGWKESRESMKAIKLPQSYLMTPVLMMKAREAFNESEVIDAITSAGYKVEE